MLLGKKPETHQPVDWSKRLQLVQEKYGLSALDYMYSSKLNEEFIRTFNDLYFQSTDDYFLSDFDNRDPLNFPGPFYTTVTDNCGTGQPEAPRNILFDEEGREHIFKQPTSTEEFTQTITAAAIDPFGSYGWDGNNFWTNELVREWWSKKSEIIERLKTTEFEETNEGQNGEYINYLNSNAELDLQRYLHYLETGKYSLDAKPHELPKLS